ncbi:MAG: hypothetical protein KGI60_04920 [Patescibacteria group bacterium]|nr:hypothetical protein [Patescibacteria group bacterium]
MTKKPYLNALAAAIYVSLVGSLFFFIPRWVPANRPDTVFAPMGMLSLLVLSAAIMGYIFFAQPVQLYVDGAKQEALSLFLRTLAAFAVITILLLALAIVL